MEKFSVALFGLSGNPPTGSHGHLGILEYLLHLSEFDEIWVLPVYIHQFTSKKLIDYHHRVEMCTISMEKLSTLKTHVKVLDLEKEVNESCGGQHGTIDTVTYILNKYNYQINIHLIIGEDAYQDICNNKWKNGERLFQLCHVHVIQRLGLPPSQQSNSFSSLISNKYPCYKRHFIPSLESISSTTVRACSVYPLWPLSFENPVLQRELDPLVYSYLKSHHLYNFSNEELWKLRRSRGCLLGMIIYATLLTLLKSSSS